MASTSISPTLEPDILEQIDFDADLNCGHPNHEKDKIVHSEVEPQAVAVLGRRCPECDCYKEFLVCKRFLDAILNGHILSCLDCKNWVIDKNTIVKLVYL